MPSSFAEPRVAEPARPRAVRLRRLGLRAIGALTGDPNVLRDYGDLESALEAELESLVAGTQTIVAGPWLSEVGFEVLYWIPFLRWIRDRYGFDPSRVVAVSRGGTSAWYDDVCGRYVDILDHMSVDEFRSLTQARWAESGGQKQGEKSRWEDIVIDRLRPALGTPRSAAVLHPSLMYGAFRDYWLGKAPIDRVTERTRFSKFALPAGDGLGDLASGEFVAMKFYFRPSFPDCPENRRFVAELVREVSGRLPVVLLNTGIEVDEHLDYDPGLHRGVHRLAAGAAGADNLTAQTAIIGRAAAFMGTYGGLAYLASALGVPACAFWSKSEAVKPEHLRLGWVAARELGTSLSAVDIGDADVLAWLDRAAVPREREALP